MACVIYQAGGIYRQLKKKDFDNLAEQLSE